MRISGNHFMKLLEKEMLKPSNSCWPMVGLRIFLPHFPPNFSKEQTSQLKRRMAGHLSGGLKSTTPHLILPFRFFDNTHTFLKGLSIPPSQHTQIGSTFPKSIVR